MVLIGRGDLGKSTFCVFAIPGRIIKANGSPITTISALTSLTRLYKRLGTVIVEATEMRGIGRVQRTVT